MIESLRVGSTATFFLLKRRLSSSAIAELFREVHANANSPSQNLFRYDRGRDGNTTWSGISFFQDRNPIFLRPSSLGDLERIWRYVLLEHRKHLEVLKVGLELPSSFKTMYLDRVPQGHIDAAIAQEGSIFEKIRLRSISASKLVLQSKLFEADDLSNSVGSAGASRYAPHVGTWADFRSAQSLAPLEQSFAEPEIT
jgi:hypothetical protein